MTCNVCLFHAAAEHLRSNRVKSIQKMQQTVLVSFWQHFLEEEVYLFQQLCLHGVWHCPLLGQRLALAAWLTCSRPSAALGGGSEGLSIVLSSCQGSSYWYMSARWWLPPASGNAACFLGLLALYGIAGALRMQSSSCSISLACHWRMI